MIMDEQSRKNIEEMEKVSGPTGIGRIARGECPVHAVSAVGCTFCPYGHMLECHYPKTCEESQCGHYLQALEEEK